ncbi:MAG: hypothetical protein GX447_03405 [Elusimicrobia bacterium]|nr:hypothetical protein [Elusimicrobiota bacterium]
MKKIIILIFFLSVSNSFSSDWQFWSENTASHKISQKENLGLGYYNYFSETISDSYFQFLTVNYSNKFYKDLGAYCEFYSESSLKSDKTWKGSFYIVPGLFYDFNLLPGLSFRIMDRFYYFLTSPSKFDYHRPRVSLSLNKGKNTFSVADEMRMDLTGSRPYGFYRNRLFMSASRKFSSVLSLGLSYIVQADKTAGDWKSVNIIQSSVKIDF